ncbi:FtsH protease activity modulator HflK [Sphingomonas sp.]|uniref:FtsH protease activity modulator HflK n=1 Tax=Sphingomonas sp. TaxID=28214 RepID=UPI0025D85D0E|nr:FtsH protease activity modulator HflK [Sphingomonas sp.]
MRGWPAAVAVWVNEGGPWGGRGSGDGGGAGGSSGGGGPRNPWNQPPDGKPRGPRGPTALDELLKRGRAGFGGGSGKLPVWTGGPLWKYAAVGLLVIWIAFSCVHRIDPQERGVVTMFGKYSRTLEPGVSLTFPAPIERVQTIDVQNIRLIDIPDGAGEKLVLTRDENIIDLDYSIRWSIKDPELYLFQLADPDATIKAVAESAMRAAIANISLNDAIGSGRTGIEAEVTQRMQALLDGYRSGVKIQGVAVKNAGPPEAVNDAFKEVSAAQQAAQTSVNQANAQAQQVIARAQGEAAAFDRVYTQYKLAPEVTRRRMYYETMEDVLSRVDKTIVEPAGVTPYLPLTGAKKVPAPVAQAGAAQ